MIVSDAKQPQDMQAIGTEQMEETIKDNKKLKQKIIPRGVNKHT